MKSSHTPSSSGPVPYHAFACGPHRTVQLSRASERGLLARPLTAEGEVDRHAAPALLPPVPARLLEQACGFLRHERRSRGACAMWWLYVQPVQGRWQAYCPPQLCTAGSFEVTATVGGCGLAEAGLWLAGSVRSVPPAVEDDAERILPLLPDHQGLHFALDLSRSLINLLAFVRAEAGVQPAPLDERLVDDPLDPALAYLAERLHFRTPATR